ncbi:hypothetical protein GAY33_32905 [Azospirillum brasilense]|uniref:hypothetical protein n=1 Tax=Azospirillum argentinense TaxID=2970906 RepID=UPI00190EC4B0|nr:hypothetical protein [Azospirillum argentinense]MBK3803895.1 hypothetical protein [Azospirillum argentinense]
MLSYLPTESERPPADPPRPCLLLMPAEMALLLEDRPGPRARPVITERATPGGPRRCFLGLAVSAQTAWEVAAHGRIDPGLNPGRRSESGLAPRTLQPAADIRLDWCRIASILQPAREIAALSWICVIDEDEPDATLRSGIRGTR